MRETLFIFGTEKEAFDKEIELLKEFLSDPLNINISKGGDGGANFSGTHSPETRAKISAKGIGRIPSLETRAKISEGNRRRVANGFVSTGNLGRKLSDSHRKKISDAVRMRNETEKELIPPKPKRGYQK